MTAIQFAGEVIFLEHLLLAMQLLS